MAMESNKIYTKTGDRGKTGLIGGTRVSKGDLRLESYGTIDELNAHLGMIRAYPLTEGEKAFMVFLQCKMFSVGGYLATDQSKVELKSETVITLKDIEAIEEQIDAYDSELPPLTKFILPGGDPQVCATHIARTVCRRAERNIIRLAETQNVDEKVIRFVNRLSDYLFVLSRHLSKKSGCEEIPWKAT